MAEDDQAGEGQSGGPEKPAQMSEREPSQETARESEQQDRQRVQKRSERRRGEESVEQQDRQQRMEARSERELAQEAAREEAARTRAAVDLEAVARRLAGEGGLRDEAEAQRQREVLMEALVSRQDIAPLRSYYASPFDRPFITISAAEAEARYQAQMQRLRMLSRADLFRAIALITVIVAIVATPIYAMTVKVTSQAFAAYIAPVTGIAGAVIGYWFGATGQNKSSEAANPAAGSTADTPDR